jgi:hypothetical protein
MASKRVSPNGLDSFLRTTIVADVRPGATANASLTVTRTFEKTQDR